MDSLNQISEKDFERIIHFLIEELYGDGNNQQELKEGELAALVNFLETRYAVEIDNKQIVDIYVDPDKKILYIETDWDPDNIPTEAFGITTTGKLIREPLTPDHILFSLYADEDDQLEDDEDHHHHHGENGSCSCSK